MMRFESSAGAQPRASLSSLPSLLAIAAVMGLFLITFIRLLPPSPSFSHAFSGLGGGNGEYTFTPSAQPEPYKPQDASEVGKKWAILIGVSKYEQYLDIQSLKYPTADVNAMAAALLKLGYENTRIIAMTSDAPRQSGLYPSRKNVIAQLTNLAKEIKPEDTLVFFFAGHSYNVDLPQGETTRPEYLLATVNASPLNPVSLEGSTLSLELLRQKMREIPARQVLYLLDAFHGNPDPAKADGDNPRTVGFTTKMKQVAEETGAKGRAGMEPAKVAVYYASAERKRSFEDPIAKQGVFARYLVESLSGKGANADKAMAIDSIAKYISETIETGWNRDNPRTPQMPQLVTFGAADSPLLVSKYAPGVLATTNAKQLDTEAKLLIKTIPADATVRVDDKVTVNGEYVINLVENKEKEVKVDVFAPEYEGKVVQVKLEQGKIHPLEVTLVKAPPLPPPLPTNGKDNAEMIKIPAGDFLMGSKPESVTRKTDGDETPQHKVYLNAYFIYRDPVTVGQFKQFCLETNRSMPAPPEHNMDWENDDLPMVNVRWQDARDYCVWAGGRLPTEAEWEKAARGENGQTFPWGEGFDESKLWCSNKSLRTGPATSLRSSNISESPYGVRDMVGNVWQWCSDWYAPDYYRSTTFWKNPVGPNINGFERVLRGGSYLDKYYEEFRAANRGKGGFSSKKPNWGFRVVLPVYSTLRQAP